jgi:hypothetical protein
VQQLSTSISGAPDDDHIGDVQNNFRIKEELEF